MCGFYTNHFKPHANEKIPFDFQPRRRRLLDGRLKGKDPDIVMERFKQGYGAYYNNRTHSGNAPKAELNGLRREAPTSWLCPVTLLVLGCYPKQINLYVPDNIYA